MTTMNVVTFELLFTPVRKSKYILLFCSAQQLDQPVIIRMADQILYICRTKDQIRRRLIELLQILILFPSDRRQKYNLHLLPEPEYRFFQNCHCNKSTLLESVGVSSSLFKTDAVNVSGSPFSCSTLRHRFFRTSSFVFPSTSVKNNSFLKYFCRKSLLSLTKSFLTLSMSLSFRNEPISKIGTGT